MLISIRVVGLIKGVRSVTKFYFVFILFLFQITYKQIFPFLTIGGNVSSVYCLMMLLLAWELLAGGIWR